MVPLSRNPGVSTVTRTAKPGRSVLLNVTSRRRCYRWPQQSLSGVKPCTVKPHTTPPSLEVCTRAASAVEESPGPAPAVQGEEFGKTYLPGQVQLIHSSKELEYYLQAYKDRLVVLKCKAKSCRPCIAFIKKYQRAAATFTDTVFLEIYGDETVDTRRMMLTMEVKSTPTFRLYRAGLPVFSFAGIADGKLVNAIQQFLQAGETGYGSEHTLEPSVAP